MTAHDAAGRAGPNPSKHASATTRPSRRPGPGGRFAKLEDRYVVGAGDLDALERHIVAVSLRFSVLSRFTAYVAIDRSEPANTSGRLHRITQPVETPQGWEIARSRPALLLRLVIFRQQGVEEPLDRRPLHVHAMYQAFDIESLSS